MCYSSIWWIVSNPWRDTASAQLTLADCRVLPGPGLSIASPTRCCPLSSHRAVTRLNATRGCTRGGAYVLTQLYYVDDDTSCRTQTHTLRSRTTGSLPRTRTYASRSCASQSAGEKPGAKCMSKRRMSAASMVRISCCASARPTQFVGPARVR
jgi:hypothetical protein